MRQVADGDGSVYQGVNGVQQNASTLSSKGEKTKIIVVGAGASGLRAADILISNGCEVVLLEGRNRIGGRIAQADVLGHLVDLGPNWIHGTEKNPLIPLAEEAKSVTQTTLFSERRIRTGSGRDLSSSEADEYSEELWTLFEEGIAYSEEHADSIGINESFFDFYKDRVFKKYKGEEERVILQQMGSVFGGIVAGDIKKQSLKNLSLERPIPGDDLYLATTYGPIAEVMARTPRKANSIVFNARVEKVEGASTGEQKHCQVYTFDGKKYTADGVIVTVPLGVLKKGRIQFEPSLPTQIQDSIEHLGYGTLDKTYITFPEAFWGTNNPSCYSFLTPNFDPNADGSTWLQIAISLAHLTPPYDHPTLLFYHHSEIARKMASFVTEYGKEGSKPYIIDYFHQYFSQLPKYDASKHKPTNVITTCWLLDDLAGNGSYTNFPVGLKDGAKDIERFQDGWEEEKIWFAGEHTAPLMGLGCVSGAYWSGEIAARKVLKNFGMPITIGVETKEMTELWSEVKTKVPTKESEAGETRAFGEEQDCN